MTVESVWIVAGVAATAAVAAIVERFRRYRLARAHPSGEHDISQQYVVKAPCGYRASVAG